MSGSEATPRPWAIMKIGSEAGISARIYAAEGMRDVAHIPMEWNGRTDGADAELIVRAVNTFSEREALLREAADGLTDWCNGREIDHAGALDFIARIRTALGETK